MKKSYNFSNFSSINFLALRWIILILLSLAIYYQTFSFGFVFDDYEFIVENPYIKNFNQIHHLWELLPKTRLIGFYSFALNYSLNQLNPEGYHIFNFIVHLITVGFVWAITDLITKYQSTNNRIRQELPFIIALLFLVHPSQIQAVTYITQRFESLATLFYLGSFYCYLRARTPSLMIQKIFLFSSSCGLAFLGIITKETAITLPLMIIASELILLNKHSASPQNLTKSFFNKIKSFKIYIFLIIAGVTLLILLMKLLETNLSALFYYTTPSASHDGDIITTGNYFLTQMRVFLTFMRLLVFPAHQNLDYDYPLSTGLLHPPLTFIGLGLIGTIIFLILKLHKRFPIIAFGLAWILITFSINLAPREHVIFEHKLYLISFGFFLAIVTALSIWIRNPKIFLTIITIIILLLSLASWQRNHIWRNELTLWEDVIKKSPNKQRVHANLGRIYTISNRHIEAVEILNKAISMDPSDFKSYLNRGNAYSGLSLEKQALDDFNQAISINPDHMAAYLRRSQMYVTQEKYEDAFLDLNKVIMLKPEMQYGYTERGFLWLNRGLYTEALKDFNTALNIAPYDIDALNGHAMVNDALGHLEVAIDDLTQALKITPKNSILYKNRASCFLKIGKKEEALKDLRISLQINPNDTEVKKFFN